MTQRLDLALLVPDFYRAMAGLERSARDSGIDHHLYELIKIRASQLNGCAYCLDMHLSDARTQGESQRRLDVLSAWREAPGQFTDGERSALALAERVTLVSEEGVPQPVWDEAVAALGEEGVAQVITATVAINCWNRLAIAIHQDLPPEH
ncbi:MAG: carboxymuconolactone decarboxylase family protein [Ornithinimicrobium sp.]|uniref:carboxymuconolactone decarboxylase family protein n=1 Tax=Ornithinimicrobium sp. TaxID=1977084 RepID=UPI0026DF5A34|nr:carboxymuconolactone decarboxylase family protein [Ornithinimicrobium sp.]MDO5739380.1 carboxymuconolactone decarboxylase family protein [Ornithinimicrobium sp.]